MSSIEFVIYESFAPMRVRAASAPRAREEQRRGADSHRRDRTPADDPEAVPGESSAYSSSAEGSCKARRDRTGGYYLARPARQINVGEVVRFIDGPIAPIQCVSRTLGERCEIGGRCGFFPLWRRVRDAVAEIVDHTTIADVVEEQQREEAASAKALMYHI